MWHGEVYVCVRNLGARSEMSVCFSVTAQGRELSLSIHNADEGKQFHQSLFEADKSQATKETSLLTIKMVGFVVGTHWLDLMEELYVFVSSNELC